MHASYTRSKQLPLMCVGNGVGAGAATFRAAPETEPIFLLVGADSGSRLFKAASAAFFWLAKQKSLVLVSNMT